MENQKPILPTEPINPVVQSSETLPTLPTQTPTPPNKRKKRIIISLILVLALSLGALAYWMLFMKEDEVAPVTQNQEQTQQTEEVEGVDNDIFYFASVNDKKVEFYDKSGAMTSTRSLNTDLYIPSSSLSINDNIQIIQKNRIFFMGGEIEGEEGGIGEPQMLTYEIYELVGDKPVLLYKVDAGENIARWVVNNDASMIYLQTSINDGDKDNGADNRLVNLETKEVTKLSNYVNDESTWSTELAFSNDNSEVGYFVNTAGKLSRVVITISDSTKTIKEYNLTCSGQELFCSPEYPEFLSPDQKYIAWGYTNNGHFGVSLVELDSGKVVSDYSLPTTDESIGNVHWSADSTKIGFDVAAFSSEGQERVGREERLMELKLGSNEPTKIFSDTSPGISDIDGYRMAWVLFYGYSLSGDYALIRNEDKTKVIQLSDNSVIATADIQQADSATYVGWVR